MLTFYTFCCLKLLQFFDFKTEEAVLSMFMLHAISDITSPTRWLRDGIYAVILDECFHLTYCNVAFPTLRIGSCILLKTYLERTKY